MRISRSIPVFAVMLYVFMLIGSPSTILAEEEPATGESTIAELKDLVEKNDNKLNEIMSILLEMKAKSEEKMKQYNQAMKDYEKRVKKWDEYRRIYDDELKNYKAELKNYKKQALEYEKRTIEYDKRAQKYDECMEKYEKNIQ